MSLRLTPPAPGCVRSRTAPTHAPGRSRPATTAGNTATSSTPSTSPTTRPRSGLSGIATLRSVGYHRCSSFLETSGAIGCRRWRWQISALRTDSHASGSHCRHQAAERGSRIRTSAKRSGRRGGMDFWRRAQHGPMDSCSASSLKTQTSSLLSLYRRPAPRLSLRCHRQGCAPEGNTSAMHATSTRRRSRHRPQFSYFSPSRARSRRARRGPG